MTQQIPLPETISETEMRQLGRVVWHSSDEDSGPDVAISVGLGESFLFAGEFHESNGWGLAIYNEKERITIALKVDRETARDLIDQLGLLLSRSAAQSSGEAQE